MAGTGPKSLLYRDKNAGRNFVRGAASCWPSPTCPTCSRRAGSTTCGPASTSTAASATSSSTSRSAASPTRPPPTATSPRCRPPTRPAGAGRRRRTGRARGGAPRRPAGPPTSCWPRPGPARRRAEPGRARPTSRSTASAGGRSARSSRTSVELMLGTPVDPGASRPGSRSTRSSWPPADGGPRPARPRPRCSRCRRHPRARSRCRRPAARSTVGPIWATGSTAHRSADADECRSRRGRARWQQDRDVLRRALRPSGPARSPSSSRATCWPPSSARPAASASCTTPSSSASACVTGATAADDLTGHDRSADRAGSGHRRSAPSAAPTGRPGRRAGRAAGPARPPGPRHRRRRRHRPPAKPPWPTPAASPAYHLTDLPVVADEPAPATRLAEPVVGSPGADRGRSGYRWGHACGLFPGLVEQLEQQVGAPARPTRRSGGRSRRTARPRRRAPAPRPRRRAPRRRSVDAEHLVDLGRASSPAATATARSTSGSPMARPSLKYAVNSPRPDVVLHARGLGARCSSRWASKVLPGSAPVEVELEALDLGHAR